MPHVDTCVTIGTKTRKVVKREILAMMPIDAYSKMPILTLTQKCGIVR
jgi:hypothetical protein